MQNLLRHACRMAPSVLAAVLVVGGVRAADLEGPLFAPTPPRFAADLSTSLDSAGASTLLIGLQVPYLEMQFVRVPAGFGAALELTVVVRRGDRQVAGDMWEERFVVPSFEAAREPTMRVQASRSFRLPPGRYRVRVTARDANGGQSSSAERDIAVSGLGRDALGLGDLVFGECGQDSSGAPSGFVRNASRRYESGLDRFCVRGTVLDLRPGDAQGPYRLRYRVREASGAPMVEGDTVLAAPDVRPFTLRPRVGGLFLGSYTLEVEVEQGKRSWKSEAAFEIEAITAPHGRQWDTLLEILEYVASTSELEPLRRAQTPEERDRAWRVFWVRRDPTPDTPRNESLLEFMSRVRYANAQFSGLGPGWRTDQGRVYIRHGQPDQIEDIGAAPGRPPLQIWHYLSLNRRFVFADRDGFGRYELVTEAGP